MVESMTASSRTPRVFGAPQRQFGVVGLASGGIWRRTDQPLAERDRLTVNCQSADWRKWLALFHHFFKYFSYQAKYRCNRSYW